MFVCRVLFRVRVPRLFLCVVCCAFGYLCFLRVVWFVLFVVVHVLCCLVLDVSYIVCSSAFEVCCLFLLVVGCSVLDVGCWLLVIA